MNHFKTSDVNIISGIYYKTITKQKKTLSAIKFESDKSSLEKLSASLDWCYKKLGE